MKYGYIKICQNGEIQIKGIDDFKFTLESLQKEVGGYIEVVHCRLIDFADDLLMVIDEEGKLKNKDINNLGTALYGNRLDCIVGDVILGTSISFESEEPDIYPFAFERALSIAKFLNDLKDFLSEHGY